MLKVAFFGSEGPFSRTTLQAVLDRHTVVAAICSPPPGGTGFWPAARRWARPLVRVLRRRRGASVAAIARAHTIPYREVAGRNASDVITLLDRIQPDIICIAGYRWVLPRAIFARPPLGAINLHASLLPRHRGPWPLFWIYHSDDRVTGVTIHRLAEGVDTGPVVLRSAYPLPRGYAVEELNRRNVERGAAAMQEVLDLLTRNAAPGEPQDERLATAAPRVAPGTRTIDFATWDVERVWHFLVGLLPRYHEPLFDGAGRAVRYRAVSGYERCPHDRAPGSVERSGPDALLFACDGVVRLSTRPEQHRAGP